MAPKRIDLPLSGLANGAIQEKLDSELEKVFEITSMIQTQKQKIKVLSQSN